MQVEIWSDVICPWCYIGKRRFEAALSQSGRRDSVQIIWRSFELDPGAPRQRPGTLEEMLSRKYGVSAAQAAAMNARVTALALEVGLEYRLAHARPGNTFDAHRLLHLAADRELGDRATERVMHAYFCESLPEGDRAALALLESDACAGAVRADEARAAELDIRGVPFFLFDGSFGVSGAQPVEVFTEALNKT